MLIYQPLDGYCFNSDTLFLYEFITHFDLGKALLEVGSGSGVLGLLIKRDFDIALTQIEKEPEFIAFNQKNSDVNKLKSTIIHSDFLSFDTTQKFDTIVSNPPFYHDGVIKSNHALRHSARYSEHLPAEAFIAKASKLLTPRGRLIFCYDPQDIVALFEALKKAKLTVEHMQFVYPKAGKTASLVMIHARKSSRAKCIVKPALFAFEGDAYSKEAQKVYKLTATHSIKCQIL